MGTRTGLFGKLPAHGDFVRRHLPRSFVTPWDEWLSAGIAAAQDALGDDWAAAWDAAPAWRFSLAAGVCGPDAVLGVMLPSVDMVGRRFAITLAALPAQDAPEDWFATLEEAARTARDGALDADMLAARLPDAPEDGTPGTTAFWGAEAAPRAMPAPADFTSLLAAAP